MANLLKALLTLSALSTTVVALPPPAISDHTIKGTPVYTQGVHSTALYTHGVFLDPLTKRHFELLTTNKHEKPEDAFQHWNDSITTSMHLERRVDREGWQDPANADPIAEAPDVPRWFWSDPNTHRKGKWKDCRKWRENMKTGCHSRHSPSPYFRAVGEKYGISMMMGMMQDALLNDTKTSFHNDNTWLYAGYGKQDKCVTSGKQRFCVSWVRHNSTITIADAKIHMANAVNCFKQGLSSSTMAIWKDGSRHAICFSDRPAGCDEAVCYQAEMHPEQPNWAYDHETWDN